MLDPHGFTSFPMPIDVPEIQKLFTIREQDVDLLRRVLPEFLALFEYDVNGRLTEAYEPMRMAIQLYNEAYDSHYWKARHILWWSAIESFYGTKRTAAMARISGLFGKKNLEVGFKTCIYEKGDIPYFFTPPPDSLHTLGEMVRMIYAVRNLSAHGQRVPDSYFTSVPHPTFHANYVEILSEALTLIIRKTIVEVLLSKRRPGFKDRDTQEDFWLHQYYLPKKQCKKRLNEMLISNRRETDGRGSKLTHLWTSRRQYCALTMRPSMVAKSASRWLQSRDYRRCPNGAIEKRCRAWLRASTKARDVQSRPLQWFKTESPAFGGASVWESIG